jgi:hypothetical protein
VTAAYITWQLIPTEDMNEICYSEVEIVSDRAHRVAGSLAFRIELEHKLSEHFKHMVSSPSVEVH